MNKKEIVNRLNSIYKSLGNMTNNETINSFGNKIIKFTDDLVDLIEELEDEIVREEKRWIMVYVTCHIQRDKRITLGTCVHKYRDCSSLRSRTQIVSMEGEIIEMLPKCSRCYNREKKEKWLNPKE